VRSAAGMGAGLSHAPIDPATGRERYVFFSFPHVAVDNEGNVGKIFRPGRKGESAACGALITALGAFKADGLEAHVKNPGVHDIDEPEFSILKQRIARRVAAEGIDVDKMDIASITKVAERTITSDLEFLIENAVDTNKADYAVCTGVQIHSWPDPETGAPAIEFVMPTKTYVVVDGKRTDIRLDAVPALTPRQLSLLSTSALQDIHPEDELLSAYLAGSTVVEIEQPDPAGNPALSGVKNRKQDLLFKNTKDGAAVQEGHQTPKWVDVYCC
jgi:Limiting CO2-inducible proteins B/C beta carbonyic anhydrases